MSDDSPDSSLIFNLVTNVLAGLPDEYPMPQHSTVPVNIRQQPPDVTSECLSLATHGQRDHFRLREVINACDRCNNLIACPIPSDVHIAVFMIDESLQWIRRTPYALRFGRLSEWVAAHFAIDTAGVHVLWRPCQVFDDGYVYEPTFMELDLPIADHPDAGLEQLQTSLATALNLRKVVIKT
jgi:hypothetical protein